MLSWFRKNSVDKLKRAYAAKLEEARDLQRYGDIVAYSAKTAEAEELLQEIDRLEAAQS